MKENKNMICDLETGVCGPADEENTELIDFNTPEPTINLYYVTDPMCSHCWAIEPVLKRFMYQYGSHFKFNTVMGGLLEKWHDGPIDPANGIYKPADVAGHWREVGEFSRMPIDGSLMIDNPVQSSYPASRVYKVIQQQHGNDKALEYLRRTREQLFPFNKNISDLNELTAIVNSLGLDGEKIVKTSEDSQSLLNEDFALARSLGVRGFPTIVMVNEENKGVKLTGAKSLEDYANGLKQVMDTNELAAQPVPEISELLKEELMLFSKELEVMYDVPKENIKEMIKENLADETYEIDNILGETYIKASE